MTNAEIAEYLSGHPNAKDEYDLIELTGLNGVGRFHARYGRVMRDGNEFVLKWPSHEAADHQLQLDLMVGRLGRLFEPPITPEPRVAIVGAAHLVGVSCTEPEVPSGRPCSHGLPPGPVFASCRLAYPVKNQLPPASPLESVARAVGFGVWLRCEDSEFVQDPQTLWAYNIDHEDSLRDADAWHEGQVPEVAFLPIPRHTHPELKQAGLYSTFIHQLSDLSAKSIVQCFAGIPNNFIGSVKQRTHLAAYALARRSSVEAAIDNFCAS